GACLNCRFAFFFFQAEDGIRDFHVTGVQTCALPILFGETSMIAKTLAEPYATVVSLRLTPVFQVAQLPTPTMTPEDAPAGGILAAPAPDRNAPVVAPPIVAQADATALVPPTASQRTPTIQKEPLDLAVLLLPTPPPLPKVTPVPTWLVEATAPSALAAATQAADTVPPEPRQTTTRVAVAGLPQPGKTTPPRTPSRAATPTETVTPLPTHVGEQMLRAT